MDWSQNEYPAGTECWVFLVETPDKRVSGILVNNYAAAVSDDEIKLHLSDLSGDWMPRLKLADGRIVAGFECWWIPKTEVN